mgnify:CR=1 FL=1
MKPTLEMVKNATELWKRVNGYDECIESPSLSTKAKKIQEIIPKFGCNQDAVREIVSLILGEDIKAPVPAGVTTPVPLACVVPLDRPNSHDYTIGYPVLIRKDYNYLYKEGKHKGNSLTSNKSSLRPGTEKEMEVALENFIEF